MCRLPIKHLTRLFPPQRLVGLASSAGVGRVFVLRSSVGDDGADLRTHEGTSALEHNQTGKREARADLEKIQGPEQV